MNHVFLRFPNFREKALTLSYDDGVVQDKRLIETMSAHGLKGTFNINSDILMREPHPQARLTVEEALKLYIPSGNEIAVHGARHLSLADVEDGVGTYDIITDRKNLEDIFGVIVKGMAYANGSYNERVIDNLRACGISYARTTVSSGNFNIPEDWLRLPATCHHNNPNLMEYAKKFLEPIDPKGYFWGQAPKLFYVWGHSYEFDNKDNWNVIEEFAACVGDREDVWYATNGEIFEYVQAYRRLEFSADFKKVYNPSAKDVYIHYFQNKDIVIPAGTMVKID